MREMGYDNIGTVEMLMGADGSFNFLEMNTRLQVEHGVTEEVTGVDLVQAQIRSAAGEKLADILPREDRDRAATRSRRASMPKTRRISSRRPASSRCSARRRTRRCASRPVIAEGRDVTPHYDPMIAKVIVHAATRDAAIDRLIEALEAFEIQGLKNNIPAVLAILRSEPFRAGRRAHRAHPRSARRRRR